MQNLEKIGYVTSNFVERCSWYSVEIDIVETVSWVERMPGFWEVYEF